MAYVRWNSKHPERISDIREGYEPFFHTVHYSMPFIETDTTDFLNMTHDSWDDAFYGYTAVKNTMQEILDADNSTIDGMLFFHFDAWIDPMGFAEMNFDKIWFPDSADPKYLCMNDTARYGDWWGWGRHLQDAALEAARLVKELHPEYVVDPKEWCTG